MSSRFRAFPELYSCVLTSSSTPVGRRRQRTMATPSAVCSMRTPETLTPRARRGVAVNCIHDLNCLLHLRFGVVTAADQDFFPVGSINANRLQQIRRDHLDTIVIGLGIVDGWLLARQYSIDHGNSNLSQLTCVLEDGRALFATNDRLDRWDFSILACHNRHWLLWRTITDTLERGNDTDTDAVIR